MTEAGVDKLSIDGLTITITEPVVEKNFYAPCTRKSDYKTNMTNFCSVSSFNTTFIFIIF